MKETLGDADKEPMTMHIADQQYFHEFPAPIMEHMHKQHSVNINATIPFFGPMMYYLIRALRCQYVLEIGHSYGYTSWYMAHAIRDNMVRFQYDRARYYGIDIVKCEDVAMMLNHLPATVMKKDSMTIRTGDFDNVTFDLIFQDGNHDSEFVIHEVEQLYDQIRGYGRGYLVCHDCYGPAEVGFNAILNNPKYNWEYVRLDDEIYGLAILRKMDGYEEKKRWPDSK